MRTAPRGFTAQRTRGLRPSGPSASRSLPHVPLLSSPRTSTLEQLSYTQPPHVRNGLNLPSEGGRVSLVLTSRPSVQEDGFFAEASWYRCVFTSATAGRALARRSPRV